MMYPPYHSLTFPAAFKLFYPVETPTNPFKAFLHALGRLKDLEILDFYCYGTILFDSNMLAFVRKVALLRKLKGFYLELSKISISIILPRPDRLQKYNLLTETPPDFLEAELPTGNPKAELP